MTDHIVFFDSDHEPSLDLLGGKCASLVSMRLTPQRSR